MSLISGNSMSTKTMPVEWSRHAATWVSWPRNADTWAYNLAAAQQEFVELVRAIADSELVRVMAGPGRDRDEAVQALQGIAHVDVVAIPTNDAWARDYAPTFVVDSATKKISAVDWHYNAWGGKYPPFDDDQRVARRVAEFLDCPHLPIDLCLEGGAIEVDELGTLFCTKTCAFDVRRNPGLSESEIERRITTAIGSTGTVWLTGDALIGDDTDGHIDQLARCAPGGVILYAWTDDESDPQHAGLAQNLADLRAGISKLGLTKQLIPLPIPDPVFFQESRIPACYCNFYLTNRSVIVPGFGATQDHAAAKLIGEQFPERNLIQLPSRNLTVGLGSFHCLTQQQPM